MVTLSQPLLLFPSKIFRHGNKNTLVVVYSVGLAEEFRSEKIPRNRLGMDTVIPRKKELIPRASTIH
jgi:hypothetical protein